jgi:hypothetical protein
MDDVLPLASRWSKILTATSGDLPGTDVGQAIAVLEHPAVLSVPVLALVFVHAHLHTGFVLDWLGLLGLGAGARHRQHESECEAS